MEGGFQGTQHLPRSLEQARPQQKGNPLVPQHQYTGTFFTKLFRILHWCTFKAQRLVLKHVNHPSRLMRLKGRCF